MTPAEQSKLAAQAGLETNECFPADTPWRRRFVDLLEQHFVHGSQGNVRPNGLLASAVNPAHVSGVAVGPAGQSVMIVESVALAKKADEIRSLREALSYYAESSNWRREVHTLGLRKAWKKPAVASDRGVMARLVLMTTEGTKCD